MRTIIISLFLIFGVQSKEFRRVCYFTNWSRNPQPSFTVEDIDVTLCTHLIYAFAKINVGTTKLNPTQDEDDNGSLNDKQGTYFQFTDLKKQNSDLKVLLSVGGATLSAQFPNVVDRPKIRQLFAENCRIYITDRNFDGLDIDWEYPKKFKDEFTLLLKDIREEFDKYSKKTSTPPLLLTIATAAGKENIDESYNITEMSRYVDFINVMTYDYASRSLTTFNSPLFSRASNQQFSQAMSQNWTIQHYLAGGAPKSKLVLGIDAAGTSFTIDPQTHDVGDHVIGKGNAGSLRKEKGSLSYYEICSDFIDKGADTKYDDEQQSVYSYLGDQWVGYDNPRSVKEKVRYAGELGLGGVMFWSLDLDDFSGKFCAEGTYPLLRAIKSTSMNYTPKTTASAMPATAAATVRTLDPRDMKGFQLFYVRDSAPRSYISIYTFSFLTLTSLSIMRVIS